MSKGRLFVVSGPSGVGKGTIVEKLLPLCPRLELSVFDKSAKLPNLCISATSKPSISISINSAIRLKSVSSISGNSNKE